MPQGSSWKQLLKNSLLCALFILAIVGGFFGLYTFDQILRVQQVLVNQEGTKINLVGLDAFENKNLLFLNEEDVSKMLKRNNPAISTIFAVKKYPNVLGIYITTRSPIIALQGDVGYYLLAEDGTIISKEREQPKNMTVISRYQKLPFLNYQAGQKVNFSDITISINFYKRLLQLGIKAKNIDVQDYTLIRFMLDDNREIRVSSEKDTETQWYQIEQLVKDLNIQGVKYKMLDVRFDKPFYSS